MKTNDIHVGQRVIVPEQTFVGVQVAASNYGEVVKIGAMDTGKKKTTLVYVVLEGGDVHEYFASQIELA